MLACVFSGQGSQYEGMGLHLCEHHASARAVYEEAADFLGYDPAGMDAVRLALTEYAQPAIITLSLAAWKAFGKMCESAAGKKPVHVFAGFSLGEYSALGTAGVLKLPQLLSLVQERGRLMQEAASQNPGAMYAVLGLADQQILDLLESVTYKDKVYAANFNSPGQLVISGLAAPAAACADDLRTAGARRIVQLNVGGAFHTPFMAGAAAELALYAANLTYHVPAGYFYSNASGGLRNDGLSWPDYLALQMCSPVRWTDEIKAIGSSGTSTFYEFGPGKVLAGLIRKILTGASVWSIDDDAGLAEAVQAYHICYNKI